MNQSSVMESSEHSSEEECYHSKPVFILNRNGKNEDELKIIFEELARAEFADTDFGDEIEVKWLKRFGKADQVHAFMVFNKDIVAEWLLSASPVSYDEMNFEILDVKGSESKADEDPCKLYYKGVPGTEEEKPTVEQQLKDFFFPIAEVKTVTFTKNWASRGEVFLEFFDAESASYVHRLASVCEFNNAFIKGTYARIQKPRASPGTPSPPNSSSPNVIRPHRSVSPMTPKSSKEEFFVPTQFE